MTHVHASPPTGQQRLFTHRPPRSAESLPFKAAYRFFDLCLQVRTDARCVLRLLRDHYPRFAGPTTDRSIEFLVRMNNGSGPSRLQISTADHRYLAFETGEGLVLKCQQLRSSVAEWISFDSRGARRVPANEISSRLEQGKIDEDESYLLAVVQLVFLRTIALQLPRCHLLHAAALTLNGFGLILPGESGQGKTMLSVALTAVGFKYLSDDISCLDLDSGKLEPFPRSLNLCSQGLPLLGPFFEGRETEYLEIDGPVDMEQFFPGSSGRRCPLRWVILLKGFRDKPVLEPIPKRDALWAAVRLSHTPIIEPGWALWKLGSIFHHLRCLHLSVGGLQETADLLRQRLQEESHDALLAS